MEGKFARRRTIDKFDRSNSGHQTLKDYLLEKTKHGWKYGEGYTIGNKKEYAPYLHNKKSIKASDFKEVGITKTSIETQSHFEAPRKSYEQVYLAPHILIKESVGKNKIPIELVDYDVVFSHEIIGIHAPISQIEELKRVFDILIINNSFYRFYIIATSNNIMVKRATALLKGDIDKLPFPSNPNELKFSEADRIIIDDVLLQQSDNNKFLSLIADVGDELQKFSNTFCKTLNSIYHNQGKKFQTFKILDSRNYFAIHFEYSEDIITPSEEKISDIEQYIQEAIPQRDTNQQHIHIQKIMKVYGKDSIILVKPKQLRYWLPSIALRDADKVFADYVKARYQDA